MLEWKFLCVVWWEGVAGAWLPCCECIVYCQPGCLIIFRGMQDPAAPATRPHGVISDQVLQEAAADLQTCLVRAASSLSGWSCIFTRIPYSLPALLRLSWNLKVGGTLSEELRIGRKLIIGYIPALSIWCLLVKQLSKSLFKSPVFQTSANNWLNEIK